MTMTTTTTISTIEDSYLLSPLSQYRKYGKFPISLALDICLVLSVIALSVITSNVYGVSQRIFGQNFQSFFFPEDYAKFNGDPADNPSMNRYFIFTLEDFGSSVDLMLSRYWIVPQQTMTPMAVFNSTGIHAEDGNFDRNPLPPPTLSHAVYASSLAAAGSGGIRNPSAQLTAEDLALSVSIYDILSPESSALPPGYNMTRASLHALMAVTASLEYALPLRSFGDNRVDSSSASPISYFLKPYDCRTWTLLLAYDFSSRHHIEVTWQWTMQGKCDRVVHVPTLLIAVVALVLAAAHEVYTFALLFLFLYHFRRALSSQKALLDAEEVRIAHLREESLSVLANLPVTDAQSRRLRDFGRAVFSRLLDGAAADSQQLGGGGETTAGAKSSRPQRRHLILEYEEGGRGASSGPQKGGGASCCCCCPSRTMGAAALNAPPQTRPSIRASKNSTEKRFEQFLARASAARNAATVAADTDPPGGTVGNGEQQWQRQGVLPSSTATGDENTERGDDDATANAIPAVDGNDDDDDDVDTDADDDEMEEERLGERFLRKHQQLKRKKLTLKHLRLTDIFSLLRVWDTCATVGCILLVVFCYYEISAHGGVVAYGQVTTLAFAAVCLLLSTLRYLDYSPALYSTILTLQEAGPKVMKFLVGVGPIFVAMGLFSLVLFAAVTPRYSTPTFSFMTLFATFNGDAVRETFLHTQQPSDTPRTLIGYAMLFGLFVIFAYVCVNCMVALIEQAFFDTRTTDGQKNLRESKQRLIRIRIAVHMLSSQAPSA